MMTTQKKTQGQQFLDVLSSAKNDKEKMFTLLRSTLEKVNPFPTEKVDFSKAINQITDMDSIASMKIAKANFNASHGAYMFFDDYIYLTANAYKENNLGSIADFKSDFKDFIDGNNKGKTIEKNKEDKIPNQQALKVAMNKMSVVNC